MAAPAVWLKLLVFVFQGRFKGPAMQVERHHIGGGESALGQIGQEEFIDDAVPDDPNLPLLFLLRWGGMRRHNNAHERTVLGEALIWAVIERAAEPAFWAGEVLIGGQVQASLDVNEIEKFVVFAALCLDSPYRRPRPARQNQSRQPPPAELQWIVDMRRGVDLLLEHCGIAPDRLGYVGHSFSASYGGTLAGIEHRLRAFVLMAGWYAVSELMRTSSHPALVEQRKRIAPEVLNAYLTAIAPLDARYYIGHAAPASLLFQYARQDPFVTVEEGERYFELASEPKEIRWYEGCGHELSAQACVDRAIWLCEKLHLDPPAQEILKLLEQVPAPIPLEQ